MNKINFTWLPNYACNYRCPYCFLNGEWEEVLKTDKYFSKEKILTAWTRIKDKYGESHICVSGGEPTFFPDFISLIKEISNMHTIGICTNLSIDVREIIDKLDPSRIDLSVGFHPHFTKLHEMLEKLNLLKQHHWRVIVECVGWPPLIPNLDNYYFNFREFNFSLLPFWGKYNGKAYPTNYTKEEKYIINKYIAHRENESFKTEPPKVKGRICRAGQVYAHILPDGQVLRCGFGGETINKIFFNDDFSLLNKPSPCNSEYCGCLEWVVC